MKKIDLKDVTFLIPLRLDSIERVENLQLTIDFLVRHFDTQNIVLDMHAGGFALTLLQWCKNNIIFNNYFKNSYNS